MFFKKGKMGIQCPSKGFPNLTGEIFDFSEDFPVPVYSDRAGEQLNYPLSTYMKPETSLKASG